MRRLWMCVLIVPVLALAAVPTAASAGSSVHAARIAPAAATLQPGSSGAAVKQLQRRLAALKYYPGPIDGLFGNDTLEAVWAFQEVQGLPGEDYVSSAMERALAHPRTPRVLVPHGGSDRIEINLGIEVLVLYRDNRVELISHVSTGGGYYYPCPGDPYATCGPAVTPTGNFRTLSFAPGWVTVPLGYMYNPVFFIGTAYAIHGDIPVPLQPVSHGCVRIPMDIAAFFHTLVRIPGEPVYIRR